MSAGCDRTSSAWQAQAAAGSVRGAAGLSDELATEDDDASTVVLAAWEHLGAGYLIRVMCCWLPASTPRYARAATCCSSCGADVGPLGQSS
jgi:hypothetical protein